jgi:hypothetical protein
MYMQRILRHCRKKGKMSSSSNVTKYLHRLMAVEDVWGVSETNVQGEITLIQIFYKKSFSSGSFFGGWDAAYADSLCVPPTAVWRWRTCPWRWFGWPPTILGKRKSSLDEIRQIGRVEDDLGAFHRQGLLDRRGGVDFGRCPGTETSPAANSDLLGLNHQELSHSLGT